MNSASGFTFPEKMLEQLNSGRLVRVDRLPGGKNNVLWSLLFETGTRRVLKDYLRINADSADRQAREWAYLSELQARSIARVPAPIFRCDSLGFSVFTHLNGVKISSLDITNDFIKLAAKHIAEVALINVGSNPFAKGAYFCIDGHINDIERRLSRLERLDFEFSRVSDLENFIKNSLRPMWIERLRLINSVQPARYFQYVKKYLSPSDFGFHNILVCDGQLGFLDFEYAGQDDLAKLVADFSLTPQTPISPKQAIIFRDSLISKMDLDTHFIGRVEILKFIGEIRWICTILNDFLPFFSDRRQQACGDEQTKRLQGKLRAAQKTFEKCKNTELSL